MLIGVAIAVYAAQQVTPAYGQNKNKTAAAVLPSTGLAGFRTAAARDPSAAHLNYIAHAPR